MEPQVPLTSPPAAAPVAPLVPPPVVPAPAPASPQTVTIPYEQFQAYQAGAQTLAQVQAAAAQAERERVQALADKQASEGHWKTASETLRTTHAAEIKERDDRAAGWESRAKTFARNAAINADLAARDNLQPGAAEKLVKLYADSLRAHPEGEGFAVRTDTFEGVKAYFDTVLADPTNAIFLKPTTQGGAGGKGNAPPPDPTRQAPMTLGEQMIQSRLAATQNQGPPGMSPVGLTVRRHQSAN